MHALELPYRAYPMPESRQSEAYSRLRMAVSPAAEPILDFLSCDPRSSFLSIVRRAAELITEWYTPYLVREIRNASHYEEALPAASLLAFSAKRHCIAQLGILMGGGRPLEVLVSIETLADVVALSPPSGARDLAYFYLSHSPLAIAQAELDNALAFSLYPPPKPGTPIIIPGSIPGFHCPTMVFIIPERYQECFRDDPAETAAPNQVQK